MNLGLRLSNWDYRSAASYFVSFNTKKRRPYFGAIHDGKVVLSSVGCIADVLWRVQKHLRDDIVLGTYIVMPDHFHGILRIEHDELLKDSREENLGTNRFQNPGKRSLSSIIGTYKAAVSRESHRLGFEMAWQIGFHSNIIPDAASEVRIRNYIINNPNKV
ncbi:MAG: transposase [Flavobacteriaceae bacterium]|nr:transposase [Flavobacteriaceae bacterium]